MPILDADAKNQFTATNLQTVFTYTFEIFDKDDIAVDQNGTILSEGTHYTVSGVGVDAGGDVTLVTGATTGDTITLYRDMELARVTDYQNSGDFLADEVDSDFDRLWAALQQNRLVGESALRAPLNDTVLTAVNTVFADIATRGDTVIGFNTAGELVYTATSQFGVGTDPIHTQTNFVTNGVLDDDTIDDGFVLTWNAANDYWEPLVGGSGGDADTLGTLSLSSSGDRYGVIPHVDVSGDLAIGRGIQFLAADGSVDAHDFNIQITGITNPTMQFRNDGGTSVALLTTDGDWTLTGWCEIATDQELRLTGATGVFMKGNFAAKEFRVYTDNSERLVLSDTLFEIQNDALAASFTIDTENGHITPAADRSGARIGKITASTSSPTGGEDDDMWFVYV